MTTAAKAKPVPETLGSALKKLRARIGISARELSDKLERQNEQFVAGIERSGQTSFDALRAIIGYFEKHPSLSEAERARVGIELVQAALGRKIDALPATDRDDDREVQKELTAGDEIWVISDIVAEDDSIEWLRLTASNLVKGVNYSYFFPFTRMDEDCHALVLRLAGACKQLSKKAGILESHLRVFHMSNVGFPITYRIIHPLDAQRRSGAYSIRAEFTNPQRVTMPFEQVSKLVRMIRSLLELGSHATPKNGMLSQLFP
jgi:hypothetical protein